MHTYPATLYLLSNKPEFFQIYRSRGVNYSKNHHQLPKFYHNRLPTLDGEKCGKTSCIGRDKTAWGGGTVNWGNGTTETTKLLPTPLQADLSINERPSKPEWCCRWNGCRHQGDGWKTVTIKCQWGGNSWMLGRQTVLVAMQPKACKAPSVHIKFNVSSDAVAHLLESH